MFRQKQRPKAVASEQVLESQSPERNDELPAPALESEERSAGEWALLVVGLLATVAVTAFVTRIARRALQEVTDE